jgi:hypothetical protein
MGVVMTAHGFGALVLVAAAAFCLATAWRSFTAPEQFARQLGMTLSNAGGFNEIRAQYAGFFFAMACVCGAALRGLFARDYAFVVLATLFGGLIGGRLISLAINRGIGGYGPTILALYGVDTAGCGLALAALALD